jgi:two-component sensor histidine kinase
MRALQKFFASTAPGSVQAYLAVALITGAAALARWALGFVVHESLPFITFFPAVLFATVIGGVVAGTFAAIAGAIIAWSAFMPHPDTWFPSSPDQLVPLATYLLGALCMVWAADHYRKRLRAEEDMRKLAVDELAHRLKNKIATIQAIVFTHLRDQPSVRTDINAALGALAAADDLLIASQGQGAELAAIVLAEVSPYDAKRTKIAGPQVMLSPQVAMTMALLMHELATNAAKYGAFSAETGTVSVQWQVDTETQLRLEWRESGGPVPQEPTQRGFGSRLFVQALAPLNGRVEAEFPSTGLVCKLTVPLGDK